MSGTLFIDGFQVVSDPFPDGGNHFRLLPVDAASFQLFRIEAEQRFIQPIEKGKLDGGVGFQQQRQITGNIAQGKTIGMIGMVQRFDGCSFRFFGTDCQMAAGLFAGHLQEGDTQSDPPRGACGVKRVLEFGDLLLIDAPSVVPYP